MEKKKKRLLLIDSNDFRRESRVHLLTRAGYEVELRDDYVSAERLDDERDFDLIVLALHGDAQKAIDYSNQLSKNTPEQPIFLLTDFGVYVPPGTLSRSIEAGDHAILIHELAAMLAGGTYVHELPISVQ